MAQDLSEDLLVQTPKWTLQPAPFSMAASASDFTAEELDNSLHAASQSQSSFFDIMNFNSALASLGKVLDASQVNLRWEGVAPDYLLINPTLSFEPGPPRKIKLSGEIYSREPFFKLTSVSASGPQTKGLDAVMKEFWKQIDRPMRALRPKAGGGMILDQESIVSDTVAEVAGAMVLDGDGNIHPLSLNSIRSTVPKGSSSQNRLIAPYNSASLMTARWGRGGVSVDVLSLANDPRNGSSNTTSNQPGVYSVKQQLGIPRTLFGEGFNSDFAALQDVSFVVADGYESYLSACYFYRGGDSASERNVVFVNYNPSDGKITANNAETRPILQSYGSTVIKDNKLLTDPVRLADRPTMRLDPTGKYWTFYSPAAGGLLVFKNASTQPGSFSAEQPRSENAGSPVAFAPLCQYRPEAGVRIVEHAFTPNGRALVLILVKTSSTEQGGESRKAVLWDFRGDHGVVVGDRQTDASQLFNGGYPTTPRCLEPVSESSGNRSFKSIRFGVSAANAPGGILILGCNNAEYEVWKFAIADAPPANRDQSSILVRRYFDGRFPDAYAGKDACPLQIEPRDNRVRIGGLKAVETRLLYSAPTLPAGFRPEDVK